MASWLMSVWSCRLSILVRMAGTTQKERETPARVTEGLFSSTNSEGANDGEVLDTADGDSVGVSVGVTDGVVDG